ncbi:MAG: HNH endonuclease signature motif containing protein [bacterium]|nr:HNH endonuclease signature motif containing protein [bacterium]
MDSTQDLLRLAARLSDAELTAQVKLLAGTEREATVALIGHLAELDRRRLYLAAGYSSLFTYCTRVLHLSEHAAYRRIEAARLARRLPVILERLAAGEVTLTTLGLLAPHLAPGNHIDLLDRARDKSRREVEALIASLRPQAPVPDQIRKLPPPRQPEASPPPPSPPSRPLTVAPLAPERYRIQLTVDADTIQKLRGVQALLRHQIPDGDLAKILDRALTALLRDLSRQKFAATDRPRPSQGSAADPRHDPRHDPRRGSRHIPAEVRRAVWARDGGRCGYVGEGGRCDERGFLEFHHVVPHASGGAATIDNIQLRCRAHNAYEAEQHGAMPVAASHP